MGKMLRWIMVGVTGLGLIAGTGSVNAAVLHSIQVDGLQHLSRETVIAALPVKVGETVSESSTDQVIKALYGTGLFREVEAEVRGDTLVIGLTENRVISNVEVIGNHNLKRKMIDNVLRQLNLVAGRQIDYNQMHHFKQALLAQYHRMGMNKAQVEVTTQMEEGNRVKLVVNIDEGVTAKVSKVIIVGNKAIGSSKIKDRMDTKSSGLFSWFTDDDVYSEEKVAQDLEAIKRLYREYGYLDVQIDSPKTTWSSDGKKVYLTVVVQENKLYHVRSVKLDGDLVGKGRELGQLITLRPGDVVSTLAISDNSKAVSDRLGDFGYGLAVVRPDYQLDHGRQLADIKLIVIPGKRVVARKIEFRGNVKTRDEVLRREMRVQEGGTFSRNRLQESQRRLANLGYLQDVTYDIAEVSGSDNQVDVTYNFKEVSSTSFNVQAGITDYHGLVYGASLSDINFLGSGKSTSLSFDNSSSFQSYGVHYYDPYFTDDRLGFGVDATLDAYNPHRVDEDLSGYRRRTYGLTGRFSLPLSDYTNLYYGLGLEHISIPDRPTVNVNPKIEGFLNRYGDSFSNIKLIAGLSYSNLDRAIFPRRGCFGSLNLEGYIPIASKDLEYYRGNARGAYYHPIYGDWIFKLNAEVAYGNGYGKTKELPFFKNYYAGGIGSVRGFETSTLSPLEDAHKVVGGNFLTLGSVSLIVPTPYPESVRLSAFVDVGNVFNNYFDMDDLRTSAGVQLEVRTPIAPIVLSFAKPLRKKPWDQTELFQFSISTSI